MAQMPEIIILRKTEETKTGVTYCMTDVKTNADRIRSMTDEELSEFCFHITDDVASYYGGDGYEPKYPVALKGWLGWLRKESDNGGAG